MKIWSRLNSKSRRCMERRYRRRYSPGRRAIYVYRPRGDLLKRLAEELQMSIPEVRKEIRKERILILKGLGYEVGDKEMV